MYLKIPIDFGRIIAKKELELTTLEHSIAQQLILVATTYFGECKFDETFGCDIWNIDFDFLMNDNDLKKTVHAALKEAIRRHETRLLLRDVEVVIREERIPLLNGFRAKKKVSARVLGKVVQTNR